MAACLSWEQEAGCSSIERSSAGNSRWPPHFSQPFSTGCMEAWISIDDVTLACSHLVATIVLAGCCQTVIRRCFAICPLFLFILLLMLAEYLINTHVQSQELLPNDLTPDDTDQAASTLSTDPSAACIPWIWIAASSYSSTAGSLYLQIPLWFFYLTFSFLSKLSVFALYDSWSYLGFNWKWKIIFCHRKLFSYIYKASFVMSGNLQRTQ